MPQTRRTFLRLTTAAGAAGAGLLPFALRARAQNATAQANDPRATDPMLGAIVHEMADTHNSIRHAGAQVHVEHLRRMSGAFRLLSAHMQQQGYDAAITQTLRAADRNAMIVMRPTPDHHRMILQTLGFDLTGVDLNTPELDTATKDRAIASVRANGTGPLFQSLSQHIDAQVQRGVQRGLVSRPIPPGVQLRPIGFQIDNQNFDTGDSGGGCAYFNAQMGVICFISQVVCLWTTPATPLCWTMVAACGLSILEDIICQYWE